MPIPEEEVAAVRAATDLATLAQEHVALKRQGRRFVGLCPFHSEKTPSFSVNAEQGLYYCFGCQASGDAITFLREVEHLDFVGAVERLADRAGIALHHTDPETGRRRQERRALEEALDAATDWYHQRLVSAPDAGPARHYLRSRGYDGDVVRAFKLGWAPDGWDQLSRALKVPDRVFEGAGLGFVNRVGRQQDGMRARIIFPIFEPGGHPVAFGGRLLATTEGSGPKYRNTPETAMYSKRRTLYGLNWAKTDVIATGEVIVCEGYTDVIAFFGAGLPRAVATCGTALAEEHFRLLRNFAKRVVLAYDADSAGQAAASRFYEWESRHEVDIAVANLPPGSDPAEVALRDPAALASAVAEARPFLEFRVVRALSADLSTPEHRARAAEAALEMVAEHPNDLVRDQYLMTIADRCQLEPARLRSRLDRLTAGGSGSARARAPVGAGGRQDLTGEVGHAPPPRRPTTPLRPNPGVEALRLAVQRPGEMQKLVSEDLFTNALYREAFMVLTRAGTINAALDLASPEAADLLCRVSVEETDADPADVARLLCLQAGLSALSALEREARTASGTRLDELAQVTAWLRRVLEELRAEPPDLGAVDRLVAWLTDRARSERPQESP